MSDPRKLDEGCMVNAETPARSDGIKSDATDARPAGRRGAARRGGPAAVVVLAALAAGALVLYGTPFGGGKRVAAAGNRTGSCARSLDAAALIDPLVRGEVAALAPAKAARDLSGIGFEDARGSRTTLAAFRGRTVLLNLWATWCVPCRAEMPSLDKLEAEMGSGTFAVVPVDIDQAKLERARGFLKEIGATNLAYYADPSADILRLLGAKGLPTSVLVGADGCEIATMAGPAAWDSADAKAVVAKAVAGEASGSPR